MSDHIKLSFGDGADGDTFDNVFGHLANGQYVVDVNGVCIQVVDTYNARRESGLLGLIFNEELGEAEPGNERFFPWEKIESVVIW